MPENGIISLPNAVPVEMHLGRGTLDHDQGSYAEERHEKKAKVLLITQETANI